MKQTTKHKLYFKSGNNEANFSYDKKSELVDMIHALGFEISKDLPNTGEMGDRSNFISWSIYTID